MGSPLATPQPLGGLLLIWSESAIQVILVLNCGGATELAIPCQDCNCVSALQLNSMLSLFLLTLVFMVPLCSLHLPLSFLHSEWLLWFYWWQTLVVSPNLLLPGFLFCLWFMVSYVTGEPDAYLCMTLTAGPPANTDPWCQRALWKYNVSYRSRQYTWYIFVTLETPF